MHGKETPMPVKLLFPLSLILLIFSVSFAQKVKFEPKEVAQLIAPAPADGWWHKTFNSMSGRRYKTSFESTDHKGKLNWQKEAIQAGTIPIARAMQLAKNWCDENKHLGNPRWEIDAVCLRLRSKDEQIEYITVVTLKTEEYDTVDIVILPNYEIIPPQFLKED